jgi:hypothetical protein
MALMMRQREMHTTQPLAPETSCLEVKIPTEMMKRCNSPGIDQISAEPIQAGGNTLCSETHKLSNSLWNRQKNCHISEKNLLLYIFIKKG